MSNDKAAAKPVATGTNGAPAEKVKRPRKPVTKSIAVDRVLRAVRDLQPSEQRQIAKMVFGLYGEDAPPVAAPVATA